MLNPAPRITPIDPSTLPLHFCSHFVVPFISSRIAETVPKVNPLFRSFDRRTDIQPSFISIPTPPLTLFLSALLRPNPERVLIQRRLIGHRDEGRRRKKQRDVLSFLLSFPPRFLLQSVPVSPFEAGYRSDSSRELIPRFPVEHGTGRRIRIWSSPPLAFDVALRSDRLSVTLFSSFVLARIFRLFVRLLSIVRLTEVRWTED